MSSRWAAPILPKLRKPLRMPRVLAAHRLWFANAVACLVRPVTMVDAGHSLRVHVNHPRMKLGEALEVKNEPGIGYRLELR